MVGDLTLSSGTLQIELASLASFDKLIVDGTATLGGSLAVSTLGGFTPVNGNSWQIIAAGGIAGLFSSITPGYTVQQQGNNLMLFFGSPTLAGDYNGDGLVNGGDYVAWRRAMSSGGTLLNETASLGTVDQADYDAWRANFGAMAAWQRRVRGAWRGAGTGDWRAIGFGRSGWFWLANAAEESPEARLRFPEVFCKNSCLAEMYRQLA